MIIAVDFDGTIVKDCYPDIGNEMPFATATLKMLAEKGHQLILWTVRSGRALDAAIEWCRKRGVEFYGVNQVFQGDERDGKNYARKPKVDIFIDDRNVGGLPDWGTIYEIITENRTYEEILLSEGHNHEHKKKSSWWHF